MGVKSDTFIHFRLVYRKGQPFYVALMAAIAAFGCITSAHGTTYQARSGSEAQQYLNQAQPGDSVVLQNGEYENVQLTITTAGATQRPIVFSAAQGGKVKFTGNSGIRIAADYIILDGFTFSKVPQMNDTVNEVILLDSANYCEVRHSAFFTCGHHKWIHIISVTNGSTNNQVHHNYLENIVGQGIGIDGGAGNTDNHIHHNWINGTQEDGLFNGQEPIQVGQGKQHYEHEHRTLVEYNLIENMRGDADRELISNKSKGNTFRYNIFIRNEPDKELVLRGGNDCIVEYNYMDRGSIRAYGTGHIIRENYLQNNVLGIRLLGGDGDKYAETYDCVIEGNTIVNSMEQGIRIGDRPAFIHDIIIRNNKIQTNNGVMYYQDTDDLKNIQWIDNVGEGKATLSTSNIKAGVRQAPINTPRPSPLSYQEVGPAWLPPTEAIRQD
ncbi:chondroitinase-B domain-containing protein [Tunicatimonas pelagia]|uniref:chondroitinase-B domain-containing protein n=1 Tax=Tunicatimonas pelagia TaxID=931531 RepID=UPI0026656650|nr:chondroitinase-B domain-containing protein [Tunicatimonas pelagia]WKN44943.1 chondroitinase-B domain-containing protein [Tunicatimonas pelagia]